MAYIDSLINQMMKVRKNTNTNDFTSEIIENKKIISELSNYIVKDSALTYYMQTDLIESYNIIPDRITMEQRRNLVLGINYFHSSELLNQSNEEQYVYDETDLNNLIQKRTDDLKYIVEIQYPEYFDDYTKKGIKEEAYTYYKKNNNFRKR